MYSFARHAPLSRKRCFQVSDCVPVKKKKYTLQILLIFDSRICLYGVSKVSRNILYVYDSSEVQNGKCISKCEDAYIS